VDELGVGGDVAGAVAVVHLLDEAVVDAHLVTLIEQEVGDMRPDESGTAGDEHACHESPFSGRRRKRGPASSRGADCPLPE
jgi:hypothetical protein